MAFDAVLIPGGGLTAAGEPPLWVQARLDAALEIPGDPWLIPLSAGTTHKPPGPKFESVAAAEYLILHGASPARILTDTWSLDTIGNAFFARVFHCEPRSLTRLLVVNSEFHMPRTRAIFDWIFSLEPHTFHVSYRQVPDAGLPEDVLAARRQKEAQSLQQVAALRERIRTLSGLHHFLFTEHDAYRANSPRQTPTAPWAASY